MTRGELEEKLRQLGLLEHQLRDAMPLIDQYHEKKVGRAKLEARVAENQEWATTFKGLVDQLESNDRGFESITLKAARLAHDGFVKRADHLMRLLAQQEKK